MKSRMKNIGKTFTAAAFLPLALAAPLSAEEEADAAAESAVSAEAKRSPLSLSLEAAYAKATKKPERGGVDMVGLDLRLNYAVDEGNQFSIGLLMLGGSENVNGIGDDLRSTNLALLGGYRVVLPVVPDRLNLFAGVRAGIAAVDYVLDGGRANGWDHYREDYDVCAVYAGEVGISYSFNDRWFVRGGYEYYGNTTKIGGGDVKFSEQQYHVFQLGAEYRF